MLNWQGQTPSEGSWQAAGLRVAIVAARFNAQVVDLLVQGAEGAWRQLGGEAKALSLTFVPGAYELPLVARRLATSGPHPVDAVVCLGAVIRGDTPHFDHVAGQAAGGILQASLAADLPIIFGVLTCDTVEQAQARAGLKAGNKGAEAMHCAIETANVLRQLADAASTRRA